MSRTPTPNESTRCNQALWPGAERSGLGTKGSLIRRQVPLSRKQVPSPARALQPPLRASRRITCNWVPSLHLDPRPSTHQEAHQVETEQEAAVSEGTGSGSPRLGLSARLLPWLWCRRGQPRDRARAWAVPELHAEAGEGRRLEKALWALTPGSSSSGQAPPPRVRLRRGECRGLPRGAGLQSEVPLAGGGGESGGEFGPCGEWTASATSV